MQKITQLYCVEFSDVLKQGGSVIKTKLPSDIGFITRIAMIITNPVMIYITPNSVDTDKSFIPVLDATLELFRQNNSIIDLPLFNNEFKVLKDFNSKSASFEYYFDLEKIFVPVFKQNIKNTDSFLVFKESDILTELRKSVSEYTNWKPNVELCIEYLKDEK